MRYELVFSECPEKLDAGWWYLHTSCRPLYILPEWHLTTGDCSSRCSSTDIDADLTAETLKKTPHGCSRRYINRSTTGLSPIQRSECYAVRVWRLIRILA